MDPSYDLSQIGGTPAGSLTASAPNSGLLSQFAALFGGNSNNGTNNGIFGSPLQLQGSAASAVAPIIGNGAGVAGGLNTGFGMNIGTGQLALGGLSTLGNLWTAWNAEKLAQQSFDFNKTLASDNYTNQADAYNTELAGKAQARGVMENQSPATTNSFIAANSLKNTV